MIEKRETRRGRIIILSLIALIAIAGTGSYLYYIKYKEPTQGIFVYEQDMRKEEIVSGHLYQSP